MLHPHRCKESPTIHNACAVPEFLSSQVTVFKVLCRGRPTIALKGKLCMKIHDCPIAVVSFRQLSPLCTYNIFLLPHNCNRRKYSQLSRNAHHYCLPRVKFARRTPRRPNLPLDHHRIDLIANYPCSSRRCVGVAGPHCIVTSGR